MFLIINVNQGLKPRVVIGLIVNKISVVSGYKLNKFS